MHHVFGGYLRSQVVCCGCGAASRRYEVALDLQLEVPHGVDRLEDVLQRHTAGGFFRVGWLCNPISNVCVFWGGGSVAPIGHAAGS